MQELSLAPPQATPAVVRVRIGSGAVTALPSFVGSRRPLVVADGVLESAAFLGRVRTLVGDAADVAIVDGGESLKAIGSVAALWDRWTGAGAGRDSVVVAVGGGSVTDAAGFAAACYLRGVPWVAVPTTVLGMADAAIGGKTGINLEAGKNLAGALHHPLAVLCDIDSLEGLPDAAFADGWAEVVKAGIIGDEGLLVDCESNAARVRAREPGIVETLIARAIRVKALVVEADPAERSRREILNFGHTVGHALERALPGLSHGRAVAIGMAAEARAAIARGRLAAGADRRILEACREMGIDVSLGEVPDGPFLQALGADKKRRAGRLRLALPARLGGHSDEPGVEVDAAELLASLRAR